MQRNSSFLDRALGKLGKASGNFHSFRPPANPPKGTNPVSQYEEAKEHRSFLSHAVPLARFGLYFAVGILVLTNVQPYVNLATAVGASLSKLGILEFLIQVPLLGWLLTTGGAIVAFIAGSILWGLLQFLEMAPVILEDEPVAIAKIITAAEDFGQYTIPGSPSNKSLDRWKRVYNAIPTKALDELDKARAIGYLIDLCLVVLYYPPIKGGIEGAQLFLVAGQISDIDFNNVGTCLFAMFGVEVGYKVYKMIANIRFLISR